MNKPAQVLFSEHDQITMAIEVTKLAEDLQEEHPQAYESIVRRLITFFRDYADSYHHKKEEEILFPEMAKKNVLLEEGALKEMLENHADFRDIIKRIENFLDKKDFRGAQQQLQIYCEDLLDHIAVENEEIFQMMETLFDDDELDKLNCRFEDSDRALGNARKEELEKLLHEIHKEMHAAGKIN